MNTQMNTQKYVALLIVSGVLLTVAGPASVQAAPSQTSQQVCVNKIVLLRKQSDLLEKEFYGRSIPASYDGGLQEAYNRKYLAWDPRIDNYASWVYKSNNQRAVDLDAVRKDRSLFIKQTEALEATYNKQIDKFYNIVAAIHSAPQPYCATDSNRSAVRDDYQMLRDGRADINTSRREIKATAKRLDAGLKSARQQRDALIKQRKIIRVIDNGAG